MQVHAALCISSFCGLLIVGTFLPRYIPKKKAVWFFSHWLTQGLGSIIAVCGVVFGFVMTPIHFDTSSLSRGGHAILGMVVFILLLLQIVLGIVSSSGGRYEQYVGWKYPLPRLFPELMHWWNGRLLLVGAAIAAFMGFFDESVYAFVYVGFAVYLCAVVAFIVLMEMYTRAAAVAVQQDDLEGNSTSSDVPLQQSTATGEYVRLRE